MTSERNKNPSNADIFKALGKLDEKVDQIHKQVVHTNGRLTKVERWKEKLETIDDYKRENPQETQSPIQQKEREEGWTVREKFLTAVILSLLAIVTALVGAGKL